jgi:hypothetical protein
MGFLVKLELRKPLAFPGSIRNRITNSIGLLNGCKQPVSLLVGRQELYFQCGFHLGNLLTILTNKNLKANGRSHLFPLHAYQR